MCPLSGEKEVLMNSAYEINTIFTLSDINKANEIIINTSQTDRKSYN